MARNFLFPGARHVAVAAAAPTSGSRQVMRIAHRGASGYAPENTWAAFHKALELEVDMIELDVRRTRDHELVVCHDARLDRLTGNAVTLRELSFTELQQHQVGGQVIPRLADVLPALTDACEINVELKERGLAEAAAAVVKALNCHHRVLFSSFLSAELLRLKAIDPALRVAALLTSAPATVGTCLRFAQLVQAEAIVVSHSAFRKRLLTAAHRAGVKVFVWTVDDAEAIAHLKGLGVDGIMSNFPDLI
ncbi:MAG: glycerophosphoryl diester phosphodiesterase [Parcubacteria group bacterium Gr01-1014_31]|nr:MAG: glycerophosphoryl diester phosphodiesterase [Parcubacteria group bacterium Gr01-1014_31]